METDNGNKTAPNTEPGKRTPDGIELRSEKVRRLLGEVPPPLVRWGTAIIVVIFAALMAAVCLLPYPYSNGESILRHIIG